MLHNHSVAEFSINEFGQQQVSVYEPPVPFVIDLPKPSRLNLITNSMVNDHEDMITEVIRGCSVPSTVIFGVTKYSDCTNCLYDPIGNKSSNRWQTGGPAPFTVGVCPMCFGVGKIPDEQTQSINLCVIYDYRNWITRLKSNIKSPRGFIQIISSIEGTYSILRRAKEIIVNTNTNTQVKARFERFGEPQPCGFGNDRKFIVSTWRRIEN